MATEHAMRNRLIGLALAAILTASGASHATLLGRDLDGNATTFEAYYDTDLYITWLADANLFKTQYDADNTVVSQIISAVPIVTDGLGPHNVVPGDFFTSTGRMTWWGAMAWAEWLSYGGYSDWRLPTAFNADGSGPCIGWDCAGSEMGHLYFNEGGLVPPLTILADPPGILDDYFTNMQAWAYWPSTDHAPDHVWAWAFVTLAGWQGYGAKDAEFYAWAVRTGDVPEPATLALMGLGLAVLGFSRRPKT